MLTSEPRPCFGKSVAGGAAFLLWLGLAAFGARAQCGSLPSWNGAAPKQANVDFVTRATPDGGADHVAPPDRVASFNLDAVKAKIEAAQAAVGK